MKRGPTIQERFEKFHEENPHVFERLVEMSLELFIAGRERFAIESLFGVLRWETAIQTTDPSSDFKLNDHYTSRYARMIMEEEPLLEGFFETRELKS